MIERRAAVFLAASFATVGLPRVARGEPVVSFSADQAELDFEAHRAELRGRVVVSSARATLRAERLSIEHLDGERVRVRGPADLFWCDAPRPPLGFRFDEATLESDAVAVRGARLRSGNTTLFYLPWVALRGPTRFGLLPPAVALRATDGPLLSAGAHIPLSRTAKLRLRAGAYVRGGEELTGDLHLPAGAFRTRIDHRGAWLAHVEGRASIAGTGSLDVDILRGGRARAGTTELDAVARPKDRATAAVMHRVDDVALGAAVRVVGDRIDGPLIYAPRWSVAQASVLGPFFGTRSLELGTFFRETGEARPMARISRDLSAVSFAGPVRVRTSLRGAALAEGTNQLRGHAFAALGADAGLPLARSFGPARHVVDPGLGLLAVAATGSSSLPTSLAPSVSRAASAVPSARVATSFVEGDLRLAARAAVGAEVARGPTKALYRGSALLVGKGSAVRVDAYGARGEGHVLTLLVDVGDEEGASAFGLLAFRSGADDVLARGLGAPTPSTMSTGSYAETGASQAAGARLPIGAGFALATRFDGDLDRSTVIGGTAGVGYVHPCGCLGASAVASSRIGRPGVDSLFLLDLAPVPGTRPLPRPRWN